MRRTPRSFPTVERLERRDTPSTFTVTTTTDAGAGSLRQAITDANNHANSGGPDRIHFNISGTGVHTIQPAAKLPDIDDPVVIDGYTQPGSSANTLAVGNNAVLTIEINGANAGQVSGLLVFAPDTTIRGLVVNGFRAGTSSTTGRGIAVLGAAATNVVIAGNFVGVNPSATAAVPNENIGVFVLSADGTRVGGSVPADRNVISGNGIRGVFANAANVVIQGNYVGTDKAGTAAVPNEFDGVFVAKNTGFQIGGANPGEGNVIAANGFSGITLNGVNNSFVQGNKIGVGADGTTPLGNGDTGLFISNQAATNLNNLIGGPTAGAANTIANSGKNGITVQDPGAVGNHFQQNSISENGRLGIDLDNDGVTANDAGDGDTGANGRQNAPVLTRLDRLAGSTHVVGKLAGRAGTAFRIELFAGPAIGPSVGEGQIFLGFVDVTTNAVGAAAFAFDHPAALPAGTAVTATATRTDTGDTSEFSNAVGGPTFNPTSFVYQDLDGDRVTVTFSRPVVTAQTIGSVLQFNTGSVLDGEAVAHQLRAIDLTALADPQPAKGTTVTVIATRGPATGGDGFAAVGRIDATGIDLGAVTIDGDLGRITAGDGDPATPGLAGLTARSMGRLGTTTQAAGGTLVSTITGKAGAVKLASDFVSGTFTADGFGTLFVGGSILGTANATPDTGRFVSTQAVGSITVRGDIVGTPGARSGSIHVAGPVGTVTVGGSILGGTGPDSGQLDVDGAVRGLTVGRNLVGGGGTASGSLLLNDTGSLLVGGSVTGGGGTDSGEINPNRLSRARVGGDLVGGAGDNSGGLFADSVGTLAIGGDVRVGSGNLSAAISATKRIGKISVNGSLIGSASDKLVIQAGGAESAGGPTDLVIGGLSVRGSVSFAKIVAGLDENFAPVNADAQIGPVTVGGDWLGSSIAAGVKSTNVFFGDADDTKASGAGVKDEAGVSSRITSLTIGGQAQGTATASGDIFGISAEVVGLVKVGGVTFPTTAGTGNDDFFVGVTADFKVNEV